MAAPNMFAAIFTSAIFPLIGSLLFFSFTRYDNLLFFFLFICPCRCSDRLEINFFLFYIGMNRLISKNSIDESCLCCE